jgi:heat shock protein HslJ
MAGMKTFRTTTIFGTVLCITMLMVSCMKQATPPLVADAAGIEGIQWYLTEVGGSPVSPMADDKQPHILLDPEEKQATGFAGCNNFFGRYELDGSSLTFGPMGATRMACPDLETGLETSVFKALESTLNGKSIAEICCFLIPMTFLPGLAGRNTIPGPWGLKENLLILPGNTGQRTGKTDRRIANPPRRPEPCHDRGPHRRLRTQLRGSVRRPGPHFGCLHGGSGRHGFDEIYIVTTAAGSGSYGTMLGFASNKDKSLSMIHFPDVREGDETFEGYMGHDTSRSRGASS